MQSVHGVTPNLASQVDGVKTVVHIGDVFYVPGKTVIVATPQEATWGVTHLSFGGRLDLGPEGRVLCNYTVTEGVATLSLWHERLCHSCPQYIKTMVDKGLVRGMMLTRRKQDTCDACHLGKTKKKSHRENINRATTKPNQVVYADLLISSKGNGTRYEAELLIMDDYSRFGTDSLTSKSSPVMNKRLQEYILWTETS
ncbi:Hypothetical protein PHPALM_8555 [Phytophthora palmivora]|uniref:GAG-pre-integrase domain-containing protein n=1 Tax=Phytophthora palmivora TaxID=4796 RepID=A0A2P4Y9J5_9STRA|nr:Hypothetical protein PHPALM_8555 [Phytophthora palmivora]